ncbi:TadE family protein [Methylobacterium sp. 4-46]|uniref:TadE/TadG family type IV pilus assembly protein n=1 Tax=unclassified Methylobacterium TaxID=2615210 RepID=UPI000152C724|nr:MULTISPECIES: TadE/TadG family type IV pilus assembly protein [Methylobacterium]ACA16847.1 TadE family protein [Methylobacterium sp. 4-46]WFT82538.1 TadE/TadG family type IV pilus assembly protein [Methylobacterium nodulans]
MLRHSVLPILRRFARARRGATAVEFGLVAIPFISLLAAIMETAIAFFAGQLLDAAVTDTARAVYTGSFQSQATQSGALTPSQALDAFRTKLCANRVTIFDCSTVKVDIRTLEDTDSFGALKPVDSTTKTWTPGFGSHYGDTVGTPPGPGKIVLVQAAVPFPIFFSMINPATFGTNQRILQSTVAFRTEPYK